MATEVVPNWITNHCNMPTNAGPNGIPNDCNMATEFDPKEIGKNDQASRIAYQLAPRETVKITTKRSLPVYHRDAYHCQRTSHKGRMDFREAYYKNPLTETLKEWITKESKTIAEWHAELNAEPHIQRPNIFQTRSKKIFYRCCLPRCPQRSRPRTH
jgi:hypothetical protein